MRRHSRPPDVRIELGRIFFVPVSFYSHEFIYPRLLPAIRVYRIALRPAEATPIARIGIWTLSFAENTQTPLTTITPRDRELQQIRLALRAPFSLETTCKQESPRSPRCRLQMLT